MKSITNLNKTLPILVMLLSVIMIPMMADDAYAAVPTVTGAIHTSTTTTVVTFSEDVDGDLAIADWAVATATITGIEDDDGNVDAGTATGTGIVTLTHSAIANNAGLGVTYTAAGNGTDLAAADNNALVTIAGGALTATDGIVPTVVITASDTASTGLTTYDTVLNYTVTFSEAMTNGEFILADITVSGTASFSAPVASNFVDTGDDTVFTFDVDTDRTKGTVSVLVAVSKATDVATNANTVSNTYMINVGNPGSTCYDCLAPTLGVSDSGVRMVSEGFSYNGNAIDVDYFFTPYPLLTVDIGKKNTAEFKIYDNNGIDALAHFEVAFGADIVGQPFSLIEPRIEVDIGFDGELTTNVVDSESILDNVKVSKSTVFCDDSNNSKCLKLSIQHTFRESLDSKVLATNMWDSAGYNNANYFNHGIEIVGDSLNPADTHWGIYQGHKHLLTETSDTTAVDEFGDSWTYNYSWTRDYVSSTSVDGPVMVFERNHSEFADYKNAQTDLATIALLEICPSCGESFVNLEESSSYDYSPRMDRQSDPAVLNALAQQQVIAQKLLSNTQ